VCQAKSNGLHIFHGAGKGALYWAVNEYNVGREEVGMILSAKWVFF
jgi:hypothetical protein